MSRSYHLPTQVLPPGLPHRYATYTRAPNDPEPVVPVVDVGGYDELIDAADSCGINLEVSGDGLTELDNAMGLLPAGIEDALEMYFGDVIIHCIPGSQWKVIRDDHPLVEVPGKKSADVMSIAKARLTTGRHTLIEVLDQLQASADHDGTPPANSTSPTSLTYPRKGGR